MLEIKGNIWDFQKENYVAVTTNGIVCKDGTAVMGRGTARQAAERYPTLARELGRMLQRQGNNVYIWHRWRLVTFPTKEDWRKSSDLRLIEKGCRQLTSLWNFGTLYMCRPGVGYGGLKWEEVKPVLEKFLDDRFVVVTL
jgi:hypothetical protein